MRKSSSAVNRHCLLAKQSGLPLISLLVKTLQRDEFGFDLPACGLAIEAVSRLLDLPWTRGEVAEAMDRISVEIDGSPLGPRHRLQEALERARGDDDFYVR